MKNIRHTGIVVRDLKRSLDFYKKILGLKVTVDSNESGKYLDSALAMKNIKVRTIKMSAGDGNLVELLSFDSPKAKKRRARRFESGISHIAFTVDNIDNTYKKMRKRGVLFNSPPVNSPDGKTKLAFCKDPEGNLIELVEVIS